jgi:hypothetical protein
VQTAQYKACLQCRCCGCNDMAQFALDHIVLAQVPAKDMGIHFYLPSARKFFNCTEKDVANRMLLPLLEVQDKCTHDTMTFRSSSASGSGWPACAQAARSLLQRKERWMWASWFRPLSPLPSASGQMHDCAWAYHAVCR